MIWVVYLTGNYVLVMEPACSVSFLSEKISLIFPMYFVPPPSLPLSDFIYSLPHAVIECPSSHLAEVIIFSLNSLL